jgi:SH3 domain-containing protein
MTEVRNGPGESSQIIGTARRGAIAEVLARESGWLRIRGPRVVLTSLLLTKASDSRLNFLEVVRHPQPRISQLFKLGSHYRSRRDLSQSSAIRR